MCAFTSVCFFIVFYLQSFPHELPVFMREYGSGLYRTDAYFLAKTLAEVSCVCFCFCVSVISGRVGLKKVYCPGQAFFHLLFSVFFDVAFLELG